MAIGQLKIGQQDSWRALRETGAGLGERAGGPDLISGLGQRVLQPPKRRRVVPSSTTVMASTFGASFNEFI